MYKLILYLEDRFKLEYEWIDALREVDVPVMFLWGDADTVSPPRIPKMVIDKTGISDDSLV